MKNITKKNFLYIVYAFFSLESTNLTAQTTLVSWSFSNSDNVATGGLGMNSSRTIIENTPDLPEFANGNSGTCSAPYIYCANWDGGSNSKYWQLSFESTGYQTITIVFDVRSSPTGPRDFKIQYSTTSGGDSGYSDVSGGSFQSSSTTCTTIPTISLPQTCDNVANVYLRIIMTSNTSQNGSTVGSSGTNGLDDIIVASAANSPLLVSFSGFKVNKSRNSFTLNWQTASELNNSHFSIERSIDGLNFSEIGIANGNGTTTETKNYEFVDHSPANGTNYYRLKQFDFDGKFEYSKVVSVDFGRKSGVLLYPTLANEAIRVRFDESTLENGTIQIFDQMGRMVALQSFDNEANEVEIPVYNLVSGRYFVKVQSGAIVENLLFFKI